MPNFTLKLTSINGTLDLSTYLRVNPGEGLDPAASAFYEPSWSSNPLKEAQELLSTETNNKELVWPLLCSGSSKDELHDLVKRINIKLQQASLQIEWKDASATDSTFFDVAFGRTEIEYNYRIGEHNYHKANLRIWVKPYGHTGTTRLIATAQASEAAFLMDLSTTLDGDFPALARLDVLPSQVATSAYYVLDDYDADAGEFFCFGARASSAAPVVIPAASLYLYGAYSTYNSTTDEAVFTMRNVYLRDHDVSHMKFDWEFNATQYVGQSYRMFMLARNRTISGIELRAYGPDPYNDSIGRDYAPLGPTVVATSYRGYGVLDLGTFEVPTSRLEDPEMYVQVIGQRLYGNDTYHGVHGKAVHGGYCPTPYYVDTATGPALQIKKLVLVPEPVTIVANSRHTPIALDTFDGTAGTSIPLTSRYDNYGNKWTLATWFNATSQWHTGVPDTTVATNTCYPFLYPAKPTGAVAAATFGNRLSIEGGVSEFTFETIGCINLSGDPWLRVQKTMLPMSASRMLYLEMHNTYYKVGLGNTTASRALSFTNRGDGRADFNLRVRMDDTNVHVTVFDVMRDVATDILPRLQSNDHAFNVNGGPGLKGSGQLDLIGYATHAAATSLLNTNSAASLAGDLQLYSMRIYRKDEETHSSASYRINSVDESVTINTRDIKHAVYGDYPRLSPSTAQQLVGLVSYLPGAYAGGPKIEVYARERFTFLR